MIDGLLKQILTLLQSCPSHPSSPDEKEGGSGSSSGSLSSPVDQSLLPAAGVTVVYANTKAPTMRVIILSIGDLCQELSQLQAQKQKQGQSESPPLPAVTAVDAANVLVPAVFSEWLASVHDYLLRDPGLRSVLLRPSKTARSG